MITEKLSKQLVLLGLIAFLGSILFLQLYVFIPSLLGALTVYIISRPFFQYLLSLRFNKSVAALMVILITVIAVLTPIYIVASMLSGKVSHALSHTSEYFEGLTQLGVKIQKLIGVDVLSNDTIGELKSFISTTLPKVLNFTLKILSSLAVTLLILFFLLINSLNIEKIVSDYLPLKPENMQLIKKEVKGAVLSNAIMIPLIALLQGVIACVGYVLFGVPDPIFWAVITAFASIIPWVGSAIIWLPLGLYLLSQNQVAMGIGLIAFAAIIIGAADNVLRILVQSRVGDTHPLITIFGIIIGLPLFGFIGLIFGPIIISIFILLLKIYSHEFYTPLSKKK